MLVRSASFQLVREMLSAIPVKSGKPRVGSWGARPMLSLSLSLWLLSSWTPWARRPRLDSEPCDLSNHALYLTVVEKEEEAVAEVGTWELASTCKPHPSSCCPLLCDYGCSARQWTGEGREGEWSGGTKFRVQGKVRG